MTSRRAAVPSRLSLQISALALSIGAAFAAPAFAQNINTMPAWNGTDFIDSWGTTGTQVYGQTITPVAGQSLLSAFTFQIGQGSGTTGAQYRASVYKWDSALQHTTGAALFTSAVGSVPVGPAFNAVTVNTGGITLTAGQQYVIYLSTNVPVQGGNGQGYVWGAVDETTYAGGNFFYMNTSNDADLATIGWDPYALDLAFIAMFGPLAPVPAPNVLQATRNLRNFAALGAAGALDVLLTNPGGDADVQNVVNAFNNLTTDQQVSDAASQTLPLMSGATNRATLDAMRGINRVVQARLENQRGVSSGDAFSGDRSVWIKPFGSWASQDARDGATGYDSRSFGFALGADQSFGAASRMGIAVAAGNIKVDGGPATATNNADIKTYQLIGYGSYSLDPRTTIDWQADIGTAKNSGRRTINFGGLNAVASGNYDSTLAHLGAGIGRSFAVNEKTTLIPSLRADYGYIRSKAYGESGAGALNLNVAASRAEELILAAEGKAVYKLDDKRSFNATLGLGYDALNKQNSITSSFVGGGPAFSTPGARPSAWLVRAGVGLAMETTSAVQIAARFDVEARESFVNQSVSINLRMPF